MRFILPLFVVLSFPAMAEFDAQRLPGNPLLSVGDTPDLRENINGPSLIRVPDWVEQPLGRYSLYFAHHQGKYIRMAYADAPTGPFTVHAGGVLPLAESAFPTEPPDPADLPEALQHTVEDGKPIPFYTHIASPDAHVVPGQRQIRMYYHGLESDGRQYTRVAVSTDGLSFTAQEEILGLAYFRVFPFEDMWYALAMPGVFYRSADGLSGFQRGPRLFDDNMRHSALLRQGTTLHVFYTRAGDAPEAILHSTIELTGDWLEWRESPATLLLKPETPWEGADLTVTASARGAIKTRVHQLRDPAVYVEGNDIYLYYAIAGESGIGVARLTPRQEQ